MDAALAAKAAEIDELAEELADALAAPNAFWLGAARRLPGDVRPPVQWSALDDHCRALARAIIQCAAEIPTEHIRLIACATEDHTPRADALDLIMNERTRMS